MVARKRNPSPPEVGEPVVVREDVTIDPDEIAYDWARSGGPGGQNVNKVNTRITLLFDVNASASLSDEQKNRIHRRLSERINREGVLRVVASRRRTQMANKRAALARFAELLAEALHREKPRKKTRPSAGAKRRRRVEKTHRGRIKESRRWRPGDE